MDNILVELSESQALGAEISGFTVRRINLKPDQSGEWQIGVDGVVSTPERTANADVRLNEQHNVSAQITVTRAEIAANLGLTEEAVTDSASLAQTRAAVTAVAFAKILPVLGLTA